MFGLKRIQVPSIFIFVVKQQLSIICTMGFEDSHPRLSSRVFDESSKSSSVSTETFPSLVESPPFVTFPRPNFMFPLDKYVPDEKSSREQLLQHERRFSDPRVPLVSEIKTISTWKWMLVFGGLSIGAFLAGKTHV